jgi:hypothetical protein
MSDGGLRQLFQKYLFQDVQWQGIETWSTGQGVPDMEYCFKGGASGWIENKLTESYSVKISPEQVAWVERRDRMGGRVFVAIRWRCAEGALKKKRDEIWLFPGSSIRALTLKKALNYMEPLVLGEDGPANWPWDRIRNELMK